MPHLFELAPTGRAKCRACGQSIPQGELRFGERIPNPFAEGETTIWFHPSCAAFKRPEPLLQALEPATELVFDRESLRERANRSLAHRRLVRVDGAERSPSSQAKCRHCRQPIARGTWRIRLAYFEESRFTPGGCVHLDCRKGYFESHDVRDRVLHFSASLSAEEREELTRALSG